MELRPAPSGADWQAVADEAAFRGNFTRAYSGGSRYAQLEALVLSPAEHRLLWEASAALGAIIGRVVEWVQRNPVLLPVLGVPPELEPWVIREPGAGPFSLFARFDWLPDTAGRWWCLECNADTPGGLPEATVWQGLARRAHRPAAALSDPNEGLAEALGAALRRWLPGVAGWLTSPGYIEDWENVLAAVGARGGEWVDGESGPLDSLYRFYPGDWLGRRPELLRRLVNGLPCANPGSSLIAQSKALPALLWHLVDERQFLTAAERDWVSAFVPRTALAPLPGPWVAKPYWEREGAGIRAGEGEGPALLNVAYQARITPAAMALPIWTLRGTERVSATPVVGVYLVEGRPAGYLTRMGGRVTDRSAHMVPTFVAG